MYLIGALLLSCKLVEFEMTSSCFDLFISTVTESSSIAGTGAVDIEILLLNLFVT